MPRVPAGCALTLQTPAFLGRGFTIEQVFGSRARVCARRPVCCAPNKFLTEFELFSGENLFCVSLYVFVIFPPMASVRVIAAI